MQGNNGGKGNEPPPPPPPPQLKMDRFFACPKCSSCFFTGQELGGHLSSHYRKKMKKERKTIAATNYTQMNSSAPRPSSQQQTTTTFGFNNYHLEIGNSLTQVSDHMNGTESLKTRDHLSRMKFKSDSKEVICDCYNDFDLTLHL